tara:strand:- start:2514 stop:2879 length:366 start_codon:yes stop_codon:yes gene_type:complete
MWKKLIENKNYQINELGEIKSEDNILNPIRNNQGLFIVCLVKNRISITYLLSDIYKNNYIDITLYEKFNIEDMYVGYSVYKSSWVSKLKVKNKNYKIICSNNQTQANKLLNDLWNSVKFKS